MLRRRLPCQVPPREDTARGEAGSRWLLSTRAKGSDEMTDELITRLAAANPVPHDGPLHIAEPIRVRPSSRLVGPRWPMIAIVTAAVLAAILVATPAWALVRDVLPFWNQPSAPSSVKVDFSRMNRGAPG